MDQSDGVPPIAVRARRSQRSRTEATRRALIDAARRRFGRNAFHDTPLEELARETGVTKGALYHHFDDKADLFEAVARQVAAEIMDQAANTALRAPAGTWDRFVIGLRSYLRIVSEHRETQRILLIDGPAVLGWMRWRAIQSEIMLPSTLYAIELLMETRVIRRGRAEPLAHLFLAALHDAALTIAHAPDSRAAADEVTDALMQLVEGLAAPRGGRPAA